MKINDMYTEANQKHLEFVKRFPVGLIEMFKKPKRKTYTFSLPQEPMEKIKRSGISISSTLAVMIYELANELPDFGVDEMIDEGEKELKEIKERARVEKEGEMITEADLPPETLEIIEAEQAFKDGYMTQEELDLFFLDKGYYDKRIKQFRYHDDKRPYIGPEVHARQREEMKQMFASTRPSVNNIHNEPPL